MFLRSNPVRVGLAGLVALLASASGSSLLAADLGGNCCADLEERIAELEATTARKGNRKVSLTVTGQVHQAILAWDDGKESDAYIVGNKNDQSNFSFLGEAAIAPGWKAGYEITLRLRDTLSDAVDQTTDDDPDGTQFQLWQSHWWIESEKLGKISLGQASRVSDTAPERDLSEAGVAAYAGVQDIGGAFIFRRSDGDLAALTWGDVYSHFNGDTANVVRYDSPTFAGFNFAASWGEDDIWDVGLSFAHEGGGITLEAAIAYTESSDENGIDGGGDTPNSTLVGSIAMLHEATGLNLTFAAGNKEFDQAVVDSDGALRTPADAKFVYAKLGWLAKLNHLGPTAFYGEYGWFKDFVSAGLDADTIASLSFTSAANVCAAAGEACRATGNEADVWGVGVVQHIEAAEMQIYAGWRRHSVDIDLVDSNGDAVGAAGLEEFDTLVAGSKIAF
jgi:hypothetical protein